MLLYECCTLKHPFEATNQYALIMKILQSPVILPTSKSASSDMIELISWLLQKDPNNRPTIKEILNQKKIRKRLMEHHIPLSEDLIDEIVTDNTSHSIETLNLRAKTSETTNKINRLPPNNNNKTAGIKNVRGDRVRGTGIQQNRIVSEKARLRYQIKPINVAFQTQSQNILAKDIDDHQFNDNFDDDATFIVHNKQLISTQAESKSIDNNETSNDCHDNNDDNDYDEDFEDYNEEDDNNNNNNNSNIKLNELQSDTKTIINEFQKSTKLTNDKNVDEKIEIEDKMDMNLLIADDGEMNLDVEDHEEEMSSVGTEQEIFALKSLIKDARKRSHETLGEVLFL